MCVSVLYRHNETIEYTWSGKLRWRLLLIDNKDTHIDFVFDCILMNGLFVVPV